MKQKSILLAVGLIVVLAANVSFTPSGEDPITTLTKKVNVLQGQVTILKNTVATQKKDFEQKISDLETIFSNQKDTILKMLPVGSVVAFAREVSKIPSGWVLCDGRTISDISSIYNGYKIPNLQSHFIRGKGQSETLKAKGGKDEIPGHNHSMSHTHEFTTNENRGEFLSSTINYLTLDRPIPDGDAFTTHSQNVTWYDQSESYDGNHSHLGTTDGSSSSYTGSSSSETNIPEYIALNYIIKIK
jgi:microcystin-dependent protein